MSTPEAQTAFPVIDAFTCVGLQPDDDRDLSADALLAQMAEEGISTALAISFSAIRYDMELGNRELAGYCADHPQLLPVAVINPAPYINLETQVASLVQYPFLGLRFTPYRQNWSLHSEPFMLALALVDKTGLPVSIETGASGDATWIASLSHGLSVPFILSLVTYATMGEALAAMESHPQLYLELSRLVSPGVVEILVNRLGHERLLFASGAPAWALSPTLEIIRTAAISDEAKAALLGGNAARVYRLPYAEAR
ncbi:MAG: amidohydrolase family protein [Anaerolineae bacterium]